MEEDAALPDVKLVEHSKISNPQFELRPPLQSLVREGFKTPAHLIHFALDCLANSEWQRIESLAERRRPDLERGGHGSFRLARGEISVGDFPAGLIELGLYLISQFKLIFQIIINPGADPLDLSAGEPGQNSLNLLNSAHGGESNEGRLDWKGVRKTERLGVSAAQANAESERPDFGAASDDPAR